MFKFIRSHFVSIKKVIIKDCRGTLTQKVEWKFRITNVARAKTYMVKSNLFQMEPK